MGRWRVWVGFAVLCGLASSEWIYGPVALVDRGSLFLVGGLIGLVWSGWWRGWGRAEVVLGVVGMGLVGVPWLVLEWAGRYLSGATVTAGMALVPVAVGLVEVAREGGGGVGDGLVPGLMGVGGLLLVVSVAMPGSWMGWWGMVGLLVVVVLMAVLGVVIHGLLRRVPVGRAMAVVLLPTGVLFRVVAMVMGGGEGTGGWWSAPVLVPVLVQLAELPLLLWLLREVRPVRLAGRFLVVPLLVLVEGYVLVRPGLTVRSGVGLGLLAVGSGWLLWLPNREAEAGLSLR